MSDDMRAAVEAVKGIPLPPVPAGRTLDVVAVWPELFAGVDEGVRNAIRQACASNWHEGWVPDRGAVADLVAQAQGEIDMAEYMRRSKARADASAERARTVG